MKAAVDLVGWVERSDTHHRSTPQLMGIAALHPSCGLTASGQKMVFATPAPSLLDDVLTEEIQLIRVAFL
jgi:hypothetical protein